MHIVLRFEIERALVNGDIEVREVPALWNEKSEAYLGLTPPTDTVGCLQDIHWSLGRIGTFQNYSIGSVLAAQLEGAMEADLGPIDEHVRTGEFDPVHDWLEENVQSHGSRYRTDELVRQATGESFTADYFLDYLTGKMEALYDL
jgi:carboxypeptidase Taq